MSSIWQNRWWVVVAAGLGLMVGTGTLVFTFSVFIKPITAEFGWGRSSVSGALAISLLCLAVTAPIVGHMIDRFGLRRVMLPGITFYALFMAALSTIGASLPLFILSFTLCCLPGGTASPLSYSKAIVLWFDHKRGLALGLALIGPGLGTAIMPQLANFLIVQAGWRTAFLGMAIMTFLCAFPAAAAFMREPLGSLPGCSVDRATRPGLPGMAPGETIRTGRFWSLVVAFFLVAVSVNGTVVHLVPLLTDRGIPTQTATNSLSLAGLFIIVGRVIAGYFLDRFFAPRVAVCCFIMPMIGIFLLTTAGSGPEVLVGAALCGMGIGSEVDLMGFMLARYFGARSFGEIYGYIYAAFLIGIGFGPFLMGASYDLLHSYTVMLTIFEAILIIATILLARLGPYAFPVYVAEPRR